MKQDDFERRRSALGLLGILAACASAVASGGCRIEVTDGTAEGGSGDGFGGAVATGDGGATATFGGAPSGSGGATATGQGGVVNGVVQGGSDNNGARTSSTNQEDCANPHAIPNEDREHAVDLGSGATICVTDSSDHDWFYVDTPSDNRAHVIQLDMSETPGSWVDVYVKADKDGSDLGRIHVSQRGLKSTSFVSVGPGTRTLFDFWGFANNTDTTTINVSVLDEADAQEPNNDRASATPIQPGTEISAQLILPYVSQTDQQVQDFYRAELGAGKHTVQVTAVPADLYPRFQVSDAANAVVSTDRGPNLGATFSFSFNAAQAGTYYLKVDNFHDFAVLYTGTKAASFSQPYKFQID